MEAWLSQLDAMPNALGIAFYDIFQYFSWWVYLGASLIYSGIVFSGEIFKDEPLIFSKTNARSIQSIIAIHINFLLVLLLLLKIACAINPSLPKWATNPIVAGDGPLDMFVMFGVTALSMGFFERSLLYVARAAEASQDISDERP